MAMHAAWARNGATVAGGEQRGPERRAGELVDGDEARHDAGVADAEVVLVHDHRQQASTPSCRRRSRPSRAGTSPPGRRRCRPGRARSWRRAAASTAARAAWTPMMIRRRSKRSATTPASRPNSNHGSPLEHDGERDEERIARLGGDEQRPRRQGDPVTEVADPGRPEQPPKVRAESSRRDRLDEEHVADFTTPRRFYPDSAGHRTPSSGQRSTPLKTTASRSSSSISQGWCGPIRRPSG